MSKIKFEQIHEDVVEVSIPSETPIDMVEQLVKSLRGRGLVEDRANSTLAVRYFYRPEDKANELADKLIKSLEGLTKDSASAGDLPHWHPKAQMAHQKKLREQAVAERRAKVGMGTTPSPKSNLSNKPAPNTSPSGVGRIPFDDPSTAGGTGKRYAYINDPVKKVEEHPGDCECGVCESIEKSNYGPKGMGQYTPADNIKRKMGNTGEVVNVGQNSNVKAYSSKPGQLSGKEQANLVSRIQNAANKKQPVTRWTPEQIAAENAKRGLKKAWGEHLPFPSAEEEILKLAKNQLEDGETAAANQLMKLMAGKSMLGSAPPPQPTNEELFGGGVVTEEMAKAAEHKWGNTFNNWMVEASKPITQRFSSEEEELAYWNSIKVNGGGDDGSSGY